MTFKIPSDQEEIKELNEKIEELTDNQIFTNGSGETSLSEGTFGRRNTAEGRADGLRGTTPRIHQLTENDESGTPTGTFNRINLVTTLAIIEHTSTPMSLKFINGKPVPGTAFRVTPKAGKALTIETGGDFDITSSISLVDDEYVDFIFFSEAETGITGGGFKPAKTGTASGVGYDTIQEEGTPLTQRSIMNFIGGTVTAVDNPGQGRTDITITSGGGVEFFGPWTALHDAGNQILDNLGKLNMTGDIDLATQDIINIDRARFAKDSGAVASVTDTVILLNSSDNFQFNTAEDNEFRFSFSNNTGIAFVHDETVPLQPLRKLQIFTDSTDTNSTVSLEIIKNFATSTSGQIIGNILFAAPSDAGGSPVILSSIQGEIEDATAGSLDGAISFFASVNSITKKFLTINDGGSDEISIFKDINVNTQNLLNIDQSRYVIDSGVVSTITDTVILLNSANHFQFNTEETNQFTFTFNNNSAFVFDHDESVPLNPLRKFQILSDSTDTNSTVAIELIRNFATSTSGQIIGQVRFAAPSDAGGSKLEFASIVGEIEDATDGSIDGAIAFFTSVNSSIEKFMSINDGGNQQIDFLKTIDLNTNFMQLTEIITPANPVANDGRFYVKDDGGVTTPFFLDSAGTETSMIASAGVSNQIIQGDSSVTVTDPTGVISFVTNSVALGNMSNSLGWVVDNSDLTISSASGKLNFQNGFSIENTNSTTTTFAIPNSEILLIKEGTDTRIQVDDNVTLNAKTDKDIIFQGAGTRVGKYDGSTDKWEFEKDILLDNGSRIRSFDSTEIGFFVTNFTGSIGTAGSSQTPSVPSISSTVANLDAAFGSAIGCWGVYNTLNAFRNIAFKITSTQWLILACPDNGNASNPVLSDVIS